jgi:hypothetical protein
LGPHQEARLEVKQGLPAQGAQTEDGSKNKDRRLGTVASTFNPSYMGGRCG